MEGCLRDSLFGSEAAVTVECVYVPKTGMYVLRKAHTATENTIRVEWCSNGAQWAVRE
jgi:hypothetical protein